MLSLLATAALLLQEQPVIEPQDWVAIGEATLAENKGKTPIHHEAKNVILFIADGMDINTITAARIYAGQKLGKLGEEHELVFESLPHLALSKTYNTNMQVPDSAGTATAMVTGHKTKAGMISVDETVMRGDCKGSQGRHLPSVMDLAAENGRTVGVISTARLTHATPATMYAHSPDRNWEADSDLPNNAEGCTDIAKQLIEQAETMPIKLAMGGGRTKFLPIDKMDPEYPDREGERADGIDLTKEWRDLSRKHRYVWNKEGFDALKPKSKDIVLGLFEPSHMQYNADLEGDSAGEPSLAEMTGYAIDRLSHERGGYVLMVEGGRIDHAHHGGNAARALEDVVAFDAAVQTAVEKTDPDETLIIVTADHGHTLVMQGYPQRGNPILGTVITANRDGSLGTQPYPAADGKPYTTLAYGNGPGSPFAGRASGEDRIERPFVTMEEAQGLDYRQQSIIPAVSETHSGQDVAIYARGPMAHLLNGVVEQNYIYYVIREALQPTE